jgi:hypothetical protein
MVSSTFAAAKVKNLYGKRTKNTVLASFIA